MYNLSVPHSRLPRVHSIPITKSAATNLTFGQLTGKFWRTLTGEEYRKVVQQALRRQRAGTHVAPILQGFTDKGKVYEPDARGIAKLLRVGRPVGDRTRMQAALDKAEFIRRNASDDKTRKQFMAATTVIKNQKALDDAKGYRLLARMITAGGVAGGAYGVSKSIRARRRQEKKASARSRVGGLLRRYWGNLSGKTYNRVFDNALRRQKAFIDPVLKHVQDATRDGKLFRLPQSQVDKLSRTGMKNVPEGFKGTFGRAYAALRGKKTQLSDNVRRAQRVALSNERKVMQARGMRDFTRAGTAAVPLLGGGMYLSRYMGDE